MDPGRLMVLFDAPVDPMQRLLLLELHGGFLSTMSWTSS